MRPGLRRTVVIAAWALVAGGAAGLLVRFTARDAWQPLAIVFYATPAPLVLAAGLCGAALAAAQRRRKLAFAGAAVGACALAVVVTSDMRTAHAAAPGARKPLTGLLWNTAHGVGGWDDKIAFAQKLDPDLFVLVEGPGRKGPDRARIAASFPQHAARSFAGHLMVLARGTATDRGLTKLSPRGGRAGAVDVEIAGRAFRVVAVDIPSQPLRDRRPLIAEVLAVAQRGDAARTLVVGDFNTPRDSTCFDAWRPAFRHAWETAGSGYDATWPLPVPVLDIDHVWAGSGVRVLSCGAGAGRTSDHRPVVFTFDVD